jgi:hypothetical protein
MKMGRRGDGHRIDPAADECIDIAEFGAAECAGDVFPLLAVGIDHADQMDAGHLRQDARMVATHDADADYAHFQRTTRTNPASPTHDPKGSLDSVTRSIP